MRCFEILCRKISYCPEVIDWGFVKGSLLLALYNQSNESGADYPLPNFMDFLNNHTSDTI